MRQLISARNSAMRPTSDPADAGPMSGMATEGGNTSVSVASTMNTPPVAKAALMKAAMKQPKPTIRIDASKWVVPSLWRVVQVIDGVVQSRIAARAANCST